MFEEYGEVNVQNSSDRQIQMNDEIFPKFKKCVNNNEAKYTHGKNMHLHE